MFNFTINSVKLLVMTRGEEIRTIILELESLKSETRDADKLYAIDANIAFYKATKSVFKYIWATK